MVTKTHPEGDATQEKGPGNHNTVVVAGDPKYLHPECGVWEIHPKGSEATQGRGRSRQLQE